MAVIAPTPIAALPAAPTISNPASFDSLADSLIASLPTFRTETNALATNVYDNAVDAATSATSATTQVGLAAAQVTLATTQAGNALTSANAASTSATSAAANAGATIWISGSTYAIGIAKFSPTNFQTYRCKVATNGSDVTDPLYDTTKWSPVIPNNVGSIIYAANNFGGF